MDGHDAVMSTGCTRVGNSPAVALDNSGKESGSLRVAVREQIPSMAVEHDLGASRGVTKDHIPRGLSLRNKQGHRLKTLNG